MPCRLFPGIDGYIRGHTECNLCYRSLTMYASKALPCFNKGLLHCLDNSSKYKMSDITATKALHNVIIVSVPGFQWFWPLPAVYSLSCGRFYGLIRLRGSSQLKVAMALRENDQAGLPSMVLYLCRQFECAVRLIWLICACSTLSARLTIAPRNLNYR